MPRKESIETRAKKYMNLLNISYEEALKVIQDDDTIDNGGKCDWEVEPTAEQKKVMRKARMADRTLKTEKATRTRKENPDKQEIINKIIECLGVEVEVLNPEREIAFTYNGTNYKITLSAPRVAKD